MLAELLSDADETVPTGLVDIVLPEFPA